MLSEVFYWLLNMSIAALPAGMVLLLLRRVRRLSRSVIYALWVVPFLRLVMPVGLPFRYSLQNLLSDLTNAVVVAPADLPLHATASNSIGAAATYDPFTYKTEQLATLFSVAGAVWAIVACSCLLTAVTLYCLARREWRDATPLENGVYRSDKVTSPAVVGILRPRILLPPYLREEDLPFVLMHERVHQRRWDNLWRAAAVAIGCVHWFNPLAWVFLKCFLTDMELSCDEAVLRRCGEEQKHNYARALLDCAEKRSLFVSAFGGAKLRVRIENILSYKRMGWLSTAFLAAFAAALAVILLTNPTM